MVKPVSRVNGGSPRPDRAGLPREKESAKKTKRAWAALEALGKLFQSSVDVAKQFRSLDRSLGIAAELAKGPLVVLGILDARQAVKDVREVLDSSKKPAERADSFLSLATDVNSIVKNVASACKIIRSVVGPAAQKAIQWIPIFNLISFVISFLSLRLFVYSTHQARTLFEGFNEAMKECMKADKLTDEVERNKAKAEALNKLLTIIDEEGIKPLRKQLMLSKEARDELIRRVQILRRHIKAKRIGANDEELMRILVGRAKTQLGFKVADLAASVAGVAAGVLIVAPVPVVGQIVGLSVFAATGAVSLVSFGARYFLINKNPFATESHSRAVRMLNSISKMVETLKQRLSMVGKGGLPQAG